MPKKIEDIVVSDRRRSIRDIPIPDSRKKVVRPAVYKNVEEEESSLPPVRTPIPRHRRGGRKKIFGLGILAIIVVVIGVLSLMNGATLSYVPKSAVLAFENETYTAHKSGGSGLFYSVVKLSRDKGMEAPAGAEQEVTRKASGVIIVYNNSTESQRLIENTRFESAAGKIYRIQKAITVPAKRTVSGSAQPGTVEATVYADEAGESYNSAPTDFTVPGLKGTARFEVIYARSKTPLAGGFVGKEKVVKAEDLTKTKADLQNKLREELWIEAEAEVPADFILFRTLSTFNFEDLPQNTSGEKAVVNQRGHIYGIMFKKSDLANYLGQKKISLPPSDIVTIPDFSSLTPSFVTTPPDDLLSLNEVNIKFSGSAKMMWVTDEVALKADLAGRSKKDIAGILNNYPTVASASVTVRPFWKTSLPDETEKIKINKLPTE